MASASNSKRHVLSVSDNDMLSGIRELVLRRAGFIVSSMSSSQALSGRCEIFDALVLCRSVPPAAAEMIARKLREDCPHAWIVRLSTSARTGGSVFDALCDPVMGPQPLLRELEAPGDHHRPFLLAANRKSRGGVFA